MHKMYQKKRSQVTLIMAIAIAILTVFSIFYFVSRSSSRERLGAEVSGKLTKDVQPIKEFVSQCLSRTAKEGLNLIGRQGGVIFRSSVDSNLDQGGLTVYDGILGSRYLRSRADDVVWYGLKGRDYEYGSPPDYRNTVEPPSYPWKRFPDYGSRTVTHFFGWYNYPPLRRGDTRGSGPNSIEKQLETFVQNRIEDCLAGISEFEKQGFAITRGEKRVDVIIGDSDVRFNFNMPLEITDTAGKGKAEFQEFTDVKNIRLGLIYEKMRLYVDNDFSNVMYEPPDFDDGGIISVVVSPNEWQLDDVVKIIDRSSVLEKDPYIFQYGRKNRRPALYYIDYPELSGKSSPTHTPTTPDDVLEDAAGNSAPFNACLAPVNGRNCCKIYQESPAIKNLIMIDPDCDTPIFRIVDYDLRRNLPQSLPAGSRVILEVWDGDEALRDAAGNPIALKDYHVIKLT